MTCKNAKKNKELQNAHKSYNIRYEREGDVKTKMYDKSKTEVLMALGIVKGQANL